MKSAQKNDIRKVLLESGQITVYEAIYDLGITQLAARIVEIEAEDGIKLTRIKNHKKNRYGRSFAYTEYILEDRDREAVLSKVW